MLHISRQCSKARLLQKTLAGHKFSAVADLSGEASINPHSTTHTGQEFELEDPRNARYLGGKLKEINPNFAVKMVAEEPIEVTGKTHTWCSGGHGALGHPKVFINLDKGIIKSCGYCGKQFRAH